jgi:hypothetical protein
MSAPYAFAFHRVRTNTFALLCCSAASIASACAMMSI